MMKVPILKGFDCADHDPIEGWEPEANEDVNYSLCLHIGPEEGEGADLFYVQIVTPQAIKEKNLGRALRKARIVVDPYRWEQVLVEVGAILERCTGGSWSQQSQLLTEFFDWEFSGYKP